MMLPCLPKKAKRLLELCCRVVEGLFLGEDTQGDLRTMILREVDEHHKVTRELIEMRCPVVH